MDLELKDKVAIVGGASKGLGRACAEVLAAEGAKVAICSRTQADLEQAAQEIRDATDTDVLTFAGDLDNHDTIRDLIATTVARFGRLDILINNSGGPPLARAYSATEEQWETAVQRSLFFFARMSREAIPHLKQRGGGRIINILASTVYQPIPNLALSGATRMGVVAFAKSLADEVGRDGILINNVCPGSILSERMLSNVTARAKELGFQCKRDWPSALPRPRWGALGNPRSWRIWWRSWPRASPAILPARPSSLMGPRCARCYRIVTVREGKDGAEAGVPALSLRIYLPHKVLIKIIPEPVFLNIQGIDTGLKMGCQLAE